MFHCFDKSIRDLRLINKIVRLIIKYIKNAAKLVGDENNLRFSAQSAYFHGILQKPAAVKPIRDIEHGKIISALRPQPG